MELRPSNPCDWSVQRTRASSRLGLDRALRHSNSCGALWRLLDLPQARWSSQSPEHLEPPKHESDDRRRLEAILLMAREPLNARKLAQLALLADATEARTLIRQLNEIYDRDERAMRVEEVAGGFQLLTRPQFAKWLRKQEHIALEERLTEAGQETLALVAYRQPIQRADIEAIRGVGCGEILKQLMERDLVTVVGRSEHLGRPYLYGTTKRFLQLFGLRNLSQLPRSQWVRELDFSTTNPKEATTAIDSPSQPLS